MTPTKPTILFIHGAWHQPWMYDPFLNELRSQGHEVIAPELRCNDYKTYADPAAADITFFSGLAEKLAEEGKEIVCAMHSYGGAVGTEAMHGLGVEQRRAKGLQGGVTRLVYICGFMVMKGYTLDAAAPDVFQYQGEFKTFKEGQDVGDFFYCDLPKEEQKRLVDAFVPHPKSCSFRVPQVAAYEEIPSTFIYGTMDKAFPYKDQQALVGALTAEGIKIDTFTLESSHSPTMSMPKKTAELVLQYA
ncbi:Alpha/Beta hydrolase protein [Echria macrotheca]|uniref:Alpha/Beta hydrolase protein n=1 Tax=Echria macrotheca TaxID=438768 RepID=A0AAJ0BBT6_9PEZI|nr:Alpha/Beta hydrolase protein [Echria macrotheca]